MSQGLLDTSVFIAQESGRAISLKHIPEQVAVSVVTLAELQLGVLLATNASVRRRRLATYRNALQFEPIPIDNAVGDEWAELRSNLGAGKKSLTANDLWIAATARHLGVPLITQDRELAKIPGVQVIVVYPCRGGRRSFLGWCRGLLSFSRFRRVVTCNWCRGCSTGTILKANR
jgi:predicted nucleic acid-binding protein